jgi:hypothetical protein
MENADIAGSSSVSYDMAARCSKTWDVSSFSFLQMETLLAFLLKTTS